VTEEQNIQITHVMIGNATKPTIADMFLCQQILLGQLVLCAVSSGSFFIAPIVRQGKAVEPINNITLGRIQVGHGKVAVIEMDDLISREKPFEVAGHLVWTKMGAVGKNGE
jgi:hypothetical protein